MAISLKTAGTWARLVTDGTVTIPGSPAAGDRMFLFATWKSFAITVTDPDGWTPIGTEFANGNGLPGNGTGSVKVMAWYRDWQSGDSDPTIDWSSNPTEGHVVIMLWQKDASESWNEPGTVTAAISAADPFSATASATIDIPDGSVVMCLIGLQDDSSTLTRSSTTAIEDDGSPNVTWNGNYVESPATHFSSTTGQDMSGDLGHRFVTTGASGVSLTTTGDPVASESGSAKWVVQSVSVVNILGADTQTYTLTGLPNSFTRALVMPATVATFTLTGTATHLERDLIVGADTATFSLSGLGTGLSKGYTLTADAQTYTLTGVVNQLLINRSLGASTATFTLTGIAAPLNKTFSMAADTASFALSGIDAGTLVSRALQSDTGSFLLTGIDVAFNEQWELDVDEATFTLDGISASLTVSRAINADTGAFSLTGIGLQTVLDVPVSVASFTLTGVPISTTVSVPVQTATFTLNGNAVSTVLSVPAVTASFILTGNGATFTVARVEPVATATFVLSGNSATLTASRSLVADTAVFSLSGIDVELTYQQQGQEVMGAEPGAFSMTGNGAGLVAAKKVDVDTATFSVTGISALLTASRALSAELAEYVLEGPSIQLVSGSRSLTATIAEFDVVGVEASFSTIRVYRFNESRAKEKMPSLSVPGDSLHSSGRSSMGESQSSISLGDGKSGSSF